MHALRAAPFYLTYDTLIRAKVLARNERGWSNASAPNSAGATIQVEPSAVNAPTRGSDTGPFQIEVIWSSLVTPYDGNSPILSYHLQYDNATNGNTWLDVVGLSPDSLLTDVNVSNYMVNGSWYMFRVRARNIFGWGPFSTASTIMAAREPGIPLAPVTSIDPLTGGLLIQW